MLLRLFKLVIGVALLASSVPMANAAAAPVIYGQQLEGFTYPYELHHYTFRSQNQNLEMGYMDILPTTRANGQTAVLMHGKIFAARLGMRRLRNYPAMAIEWLSRIKLVFVARLNHNLISTHFSNSRKIHIHF